MTRVSLERIADTLYPKEQPRNSTAYGSVESINADGSYQVKLNSSGTTTRCAKLCDAAVGDRVLVLIQANGHCAAIGRVGGSVDRIIEQGTSGDFTYRKYASGVSECWGSVSRTFNISTTWGNLVYSEEWYESFPSGIFASAPTFCEIGWASNSGQNWAMVVLGDGLTASKTQGYALARPGGASATVSGKTQVHAIGRWV